MRKIFNILFIHFTLLVSGFGQEASSVRVTYKCINKPLPIVLNELSKSSGINIIYSESKFKIQKPVTIQANNEKLIDVLTFVLEPSKLTYEIIGNVITIVNAKDKEIQQNFTISGFIKDKEDGEILPYATIYATDKSFGVFANEAGYFSVKLKRGTYQLAFSYIGYKEDTIKVFLQMDTLMNIQLHQNNTLTEIKIEEDLNRIAFRYGEEFLSKDRIAGAQYFGGEADVIKAVNTMAGVASGADGFGGISVRGGNYDQNLVLFDGVPVQNTGHGFGLISIFNSNIIQDARLVKGAFPARYGGRLSSVLDIKTKDGNKKNIEGEFSISTIASKAHLEIPVIKDKASLLLAYRRTFADPWIKGISTYINQSADTKGSTSYKFDDLNVKFNADLGRNHKLSLSYYKGTDGLKSTSLFEKKPDEVNFVEQSVLDQYWGNTIASIHFDSRLGSRTFSKFISYHSVWENENYRFKRIASDSADVVNDLYNVDYKFSDFKTNGIKWSLDHQLSRNNIVRLGVNHQSFHFLPRFNTYNNAGKKRIYPIIPSIADVLSEGDFKAYQSSDLSAFIEEELTFGGVILNGGLHASKYTYDTTTYNSLQPRLSIQVNGEKMWFNLAASSLRQFQQVVSENNLGFPNDFWVNATNHIAPADALLASVNFGFLATPSLSINIGGYYKKMKNLIALAEGRALQADPGDEWQKLLDKGTGIALGAELTVRYNTPRINLETNFTFGNSTRAFNESNNGNEFNYRYNRKWMSNSTLNVKLSKRTEFTSVITYQQGSWVSFPSGGVFVRNVNGEEVIYPIYTSKHNQTFDDYIRLDLGLTFISNNKLGRHRIFAGLYNLLNRKNPIYLDLDRNTFEPNVLEVSKVSIFPIVPSLSYSLMFGKNKTP